MTRKPLVLALMTLGLVGQAPLAGATGRTEVLGLGNFGTAPNGYSYSYAVALNDNGQVTGSSVAYANGNYQGGLAFLWSNGAMTNLGALSTDANGAGYSTPAAINNAGQVAGSFNTFANGNYMGDRAFIWSNGTMTNLGSLGTDASGYGYSNAKGINNLGQVIGDSFYYSGGTSLGNRAVLWSNGAMINLGTLSGRTTGSDYSTAVAINNAGQVVGTSYAADLKGYRAFLWSNGTMTDLGFLGDASAIGSSYAKAINDNGQVIGKSTYYSNGVNLGYRAFLWSNGTMIDLGTLSSYPNSYSTSEAVAINNAGQVVGSSDYIAGGFNWGSRAFLWTNGTMTNLGSFGGSSNAVALNDTAQVVGTSVTSSGATHLFLYNAGTMYDISNFAPASWTFEQVVGINANGQVAGYGQHNGNREAFLFTPHPDWQGGDGSWADASRWNYGGMGAFGFTPGTPHDVVINPTGSATVYGPANASVHSLTVAGTGNNLATLNLGGGQISASNGSTLGANGTLAGSGRLAGNLALRSGGRVYVRDYENMQLAGNVGNAGRVDVQATGGSGRGNLEIGGSLTNAVGGAVNLMNADLYAHSGTVNQGRINIAGNTTVSGTVDNQTGGKINISGANALAIFWDDFRNNGSVTITPGSTATFFGLVKGAGSFLGSGNKEFAGGYAPGNSPARVYLEGPVAFTAGTVTMELGGLSAGDEYDKLVFSGPVTLAGADLDVVWYDGFTGKAGDDFDLFDWGGGLNGTFTQIALPTLASGLVWHTDNLYTTGDISIAAVPEPESYAMFLAGLGLLGGLARRRRAM